MEKYKAQAASVESLLRAVLKISPRHRGTKPVCRQAGFTKRMSPNHILPTTTYLLHELTYHATPDCRQAGVTAYPTSDYQCYRPNPYTLSSRQLSFAHLLLRSCW